MLESAATPINSLISGIVPGYEWAVIAIISFGIAWYIVKRSTIGIMTLIGLLGSLIFLVLRFIAGLGKGLP